MRSQMKWLVTMMLLAVIVTVGTVEAGYVQYGPDAWAEEDDPADTQTSTMEEYTRVDTDAQEWGYCHCDVYTRAWATPVDSAMADASGAAVLGLLGGSARGRQGGK